MKILTIFNHSVVLLLLIVTSVFNPNLINTDIDNQVFVPLNDIMLSNGYTHLNDEQIISFNNHQWTTKYPPLVAHAGGIIENNIYSNSLEALILNYNLGHRIFEFDFCLTSDNHLAATHDWNNFDNKQLHSSEWQKYKIFNKFTTLEIGNILDELMINKDMYIITDTKEKSKEKVTTQFKIIYAEAVRREKELLNRIIPQIYDEEMYSVIKKIYEFPSIIYTLYQTSSSDEKVFNFVKDKEDIKVITMWGDRADGQTGLEFINNLNKINKLVYVHTINEPEKIRYFLNRGVHGIYTDSFLPSDYLKLENNTQIKK